MRWMLGLLLFLLVGCGVAGFGVAGSGVAGSASAAAADLAPVAAPPAGPPGFRLPVDGPPTVLTPFRLPATRYGPGHRGVDLAAAPGSPVVAAAAGVVVFAGPLAGRGVVSVQHPNGIRTTYEPVTASVTAGQSVAAGAPLGVVEAGHAACAPAVCLHWGARIGEDYLDPMLLLGPWRVRLVPWEGLHLE